MCYGLGRLLIQSSHRQALPAVSDLTAATHPEFTKADKVVVVAYLESSDTTNKKTYNDFAEAHRDDYLFGQTTDSAAIAAAGVNVPALVLYKTFDEGRNDYTSSFTNEGIAEFIRDHATPLLDEITPDNFATYAEAGLPLAYIFIEADDPHREGVVTALEPLARKHKSDINFVWIDAAKFADHAKSLNLPEPKWPSFAIQNVAESEYSFTFDHFYAHHFVVQCSNTRYRRTKTFPQR